MKIEVDPIKMLDLFDNKQRYEFDIPIPLEIFFGLLKRNIDFSVNAL